MTRLTRDMRDTIIVKAMKDYKAAEKKQFEADLQVFANKAYDLEFGSDEAVIRGSKLSARWYVLEDAVRIECEGFEGRYRGMSYSAHQFNATDEDIDADLKLGRDRAFPSNSSVDCSILIEDTHPLYAEAQALVKRFQAIRESEADVRSKIRALLTSCNTLKQLEEAWPEAVQFIPAGTSYSTALVPVGLSDQINKALGIPPKDSVATKAVRKAAKQ